MKTVLRALAATSGSFSIVGIGALASSETDKRRYKIQRACRTFEKTCRTSRPVQCESAAIKDDAPAQRRLLSSDGSPPKFSSRFRGAASRPAAKKSATQRDVRESSGDAVSRKDPKEDVVTQEIFFWGTRDSLPYGVVDSETAAKSRLRQSRAKGKARYLEDSTPQPDGHRRPHRSRWFDSHQYDWQTIALGSHFGAAVDAKGDAYIWGSFIPPVSVGPIPLLPMQRNHAETHEPAVFLMTHQTTAQIPTEKRHPSFPEKLAIEEAEKYRVFVGPLKLEINEGVKDIKAGVNKLYILTKTGTVYCLDDLLTYLHWRAYDNYIVSAPPVSNPFPTTHSTLLDLGDESHTKTQIIPRKQFESLSSQLPAGGSTLESQLEIDRRLSSTVLLNPDDNTIIVPDTFDGGNTETEKVDDPEEAASTATTQPRFIRIGNEDVRDPRDMPVQWAERNAPFLLKQLPQPGRFRGERIVQIEAGLDHLVCRSNKGNVYCVGDNVFGQCGAPPENNEFVPVHKVRKYWETCNAQTLPPIIFQLYIPSELRVTDIAAGGRHTLVQDEAGAVYSFGDDSRLQLGQGDTRQAVLPALARSTQSNLAWNENSAMPLYSSMNYKLLEPHMTSNAREVMKPIMLDRNTYGPPDLMRCGAFHSCLRFPTSPQWLTSLATSEIHCTGENLRGDCGSGDTPAQQPFKPVRLPKQFSLLDMSCGLHHCVGFLSSGELYGWGDNSKGQVGRPRPLKIVQPTVITLDKKDRSSLREYLPATTVAPVAPASNSARDSRMSRGQIGDFIDEIERTLHKPDESDFSKQQKISSNGKPFPRIFQDYAKFRSVDLLAAGDITHIACGFNSSCVIREHGLNTLQI